MDTAVENMGSREIENLLRRIGPYCGAAFDFDDTLACSEIVTAGVTASLVNPYLTEAGHAPLGVEEICRKYSGLSFDKQAAQLQATFEVQFPAEVLTQKERRNIQALSREAQAINGAEQVLEFLREIGAKAIVFTASKSDRVEATIDCIGFNSHLTTDLSGKCGRIPVISAKQPFIWRGQAFSAVKGKPHPEGYMVVANLLGIPANRMLGCEDSESGVLALAGAGYGAAAIVATSRRCQLLHENHMHELAAHFDGTQTKTVFVTGSWRPAMMQMLEMGLQNARDNDIQGLPERLPAEVDEWLWAKLAPPAGGRKDFYAAPQRMEPVRR